MLKSFNLDQHFNYYFFVLQRYGKKFQHVIGANVARGYPMPLAKRILLECCEHENCKEYLLKYDCQLYSAYNGDVLCNAQTAKEAQRPQSSESITTLRRYLEGVQDYPSLYIVLFRKKQVQLIFLEVLECIYGIQSSCLFSTSLYSSDGSMRCWIAMATIGLHIAR